MPIGLARPDFLGLRGRRGSDLVILDSRWIGEAVKDGHLVELTAWMRANIQIDDYVPAALSAYGPPAWPASKSESLRTRRPEARFPSC